MHCENSYKIQIEDSKSIILRKINGDEAFVYKPSLAQRAISFSITYLRYGIWKIAYTSLFYLIPVVLLRMGLTLGSSMSDYFPHAKDSSRNLHISNHSPYGIRSKLGHCRILQRHYHLVVNGMGKTSFYNGFVSFYIHLGCDDFRYYGPWVNVVLHQEQRRREKRKGHISNVFLYFKGFDFIEYRLCSNSRICMYTNINFSLLKT